MSFTEQDMKKQMDDFAALREEFSRLESQEKAMRKQLGLPEQGQEKTDPASLAPALRKMVEEAEAETYSNGKTEKNTKNCTLMSKEMVDYMDAHGLAYDKTGGDYNHSSDEWDVAITALEGRLEELGSNTQQEMVYIQDYMGQYNSYLQGANTQISNANQTLTSLARGQ